MVRPMSHAPRFETPYAVPVTEADLEPAPPDTQATAEGRAFLSGWNEAMASVKGLVKGLERENAELKATLASYKDVL